jgi:hypothetical protein
MKRWIKGRDIILIAIGLACYAFVMYIAAPGTKSWLETFPPVTLRQVIGTVQVILIILLILALLSLIQWKPSGSLKPVDITIIILRIFMGMAAIYGLLEVTSFMKDLHWFE